MWNWEHKHWPNFEYDRDIVVDLEKKFLENSAIGKGLLLSFSKENKNKIIIDLLENEAITTSEIEGEYLMRSSVQSSLQKNFGLRVDVKKTTPSEQGIADMMTEIYVSSTKEITKNTLLHWHCLLMKGQEKIILCGKFRTGKEPMQVISGYAGKITVHYQAPPSEKIPNEIKQFLHWYLNTEKNMSALVRAAIVHLYFVSIHPFEDGNGRISRSLSEKSLSESLGYASLVSLSTIILKNRTEYYNQLQQANKTLKINNWILYFSQIIIDAQEYTQKKILFVVDKINFYQKYSEKLNERQKKVIEKIFASGLDDFEGGLSADNYKKITKTSSSTATRDLQKLLEIKAVYKRGEKKYSRYYINI